MFSKHRDSSPKSWTHKAQEAVDGAREDAVDVSTADVSGTEVNSLSKTIMIVNQKGLHARATAKFVQCVEKFKAKVRVAKGTEVVGGTSIMGILTLGAAKGSTITIHAAGEEAQGVLDALTHLIEARFGEDE